MSLFATTAIGHVFAKTIVLGSFYCFNRILITLTRIFPPRKGAFPQIQHLYGCNNGSHQIEAGKMATALDGLKGKELEQYDDLADDEKGGYL